MARKKLASYKDFRDSIRTGFHYSEKSDEDMIHHHILDCISALAEMRKVERKSSEAIDEALAASKRRVFRQALQEILNDQQVESHVVDFSEVNSALSTVLDSFIQDNKKRFDNGRRSWMPLHWAVSLPSVNMQDIKILITAHPKVESSFTMSDNRSHFGYNPVHLACMMNARVEVLHLLHYHFPLWGESLTECCNRFTPLHLAVKYSSSLALVRELVRLYPAALAMRDRHGNIPLHLISTKSSEGPQILQALLEAAPHTARTKNHIIQQLPLHCLLQNCDDKDSPTVLKMATILIAAYPDAVDIRDDRNGWLPIHYAAAHAPVQVFQMIAEKNMANLSNDRYAVSATQLAIQYQKFENLRYIHSVKPELLMEKSIYGGNSVIMSALLQPIKSYEELSSPISGRSEILRFLLRHYRTITETTEHSEDGDPFGFREQCDPFGALYVKLTFKEKAKGLDLSYPRRLLLAGHPSLCLPEVLRDLNYSARRGALLLFFYPHADDDTSSRAADNIFWWIRNGPGSKELIRTIIGFL